MAKLKTSVPLQGGARPYDATVKAYAQQRAAAVEAQEEDALLNEVAGLKTCAPLRALICVAPSRSGYQATALVSPLNLRRVSSLGHADWMCRW